MPGAYEKQIHGERYDTILAVVQGCRSLLKRSLQDAERSASIAVDPSLPSQSLAELRLKLAFLVLLMTDTSKNRVEEFCYAGGFHLVFDTLENLACLYPNMNDWDRTVYNDLAKTAMDFLSALLVFEVDPFDQDLGVMPTLIYFLSERHTHYVDIDWNAHELTLMPRFLEALLVVVTKLASADAVQAKSNAITAVNLLYGTLILFPPHRVVRRAAGVFSTEACKDLIYAVRQLKTQQAWDSGERARFEISRLFFSIAAFGLGPVICADMPLAILLLTLGSTMLPEVRCSCSRCEFFRRLQRTGRERDEFGVPSAAETKRSIPFALVRANIVALMEDLLEEGVGLESISLPNTALMSIDEDRHNSDESPNSCLAYEKRSTSTEGEHTKAISNVNFEQSGVEHPVSQSIHDRDSFTTVAKSDEERLHITEPLTREKSFTLPEESDYEPAVNSAALFGVANVPKPPSSNEDVGLSMAGTTSGSTTGSPSSFEHLLQQSDRKEAECEIPAGSLRNSAKQDVTAGLESVTFEGFSVIPPSQEPVQAIVGADTGGEETALVKVSDNTPDESVQEEHEAGYFRVRARRNQAHLLLKYGEACSEYIKDQTLRYVALVMHLCAYPFEEIFREKNILSHNNQRLVVTFLQSLNLKNPHYLFNAESGEFLPGVQVALDVLCIHALRMRDSKSREMEFENVRLRLRPTAEVLLEALYLKIMHHCGETGHSWTPSLASLIPTQAGLLALVYCSEEVLVPRPDFDRQLEFSRSALPRKYRAPKLSRTLMKSCMDALNRFIDGYAWKANLLTDEDDEQTLMVGLLLTMAVLTECSEYMRCHEKKRKYFPPPDPRTGFMAYHARWILDLYSASASKKQTTICSVIRTLASMVISRAEKASALVRVLNKNERDALHVTSYAENIFHNATGV